MFEPSRMELRALLQSAKANLRAQEEILANLENPGQAPDSQPEAKDGERSQVSRTWHRLRAHHRNVLVHLARSTDGAPRPQRFQMERTLSTLHLKGRELGDRWWYLDGGRGD